MPGQFIFGRESTALALGQKPSSTWKRLLKLKKLGNVDIESDSQYSIVTVCNWGTYQYDADEKEQRKELPGDRRVTGGGQARDTDKTLKTLSDVPDEKETEGTATPQPPTPATVKYAILKTAWNGIPRIYCTPCRGSSPKRLTALRARLKESGWWDDCIEAMRKIDGGECGFFGDNDRGWKPDMEWFLKPDSVLKILEDKYKGKPLGSFDAFLAADDAKDKAELDRLSEEGE